MIKIPDSESNAVLLYQLIHDFLRQNSMYTQSIVGVLETIKLEFVIDAINEMEEIDDEEDDEDIMGYK